MSDPVSTMDVEDVLSSIRRLVSEEAKGAVAESVPHAELADIHEQAENAAEDAIAALSEGKDDPSAADPKMSFRHQAAQARASADQKLVLTAALRVADPDEGQVGPDSGPDSVPDSGPDSVPDDISPREETGSRHAPEQEIGGSQRPQRRHLRSVSDLQDAPVASDPQPIDEQTAHDHGPQGSDDSHERRFDVAPDDTLFERARRAMQAVAEAPEAPPAFVFNGVAEAGGEIASDDAPVETLDTFELAQNDAEEETVTAKTAPPPLADTPTSAASETSEQVTEASDEIEAAETPSASPFSAGAGAFAEPSEDAHNELSTIDFTEEEESILDEDMLRDLVSEMVRSELQGELGDRITRNVRKLVRREIQRALASREFE